MILDLSGRSNCIIAGLKIQICNMEILSYCLPDSIRTLTHLRPDGSVDAQTYVFDFTAPTSVEGDEIHLSSQTFGGSALSEVYFAGAFHITFTYDDVIKTDYRPCFK